MELEKPIHELLCAIIQETIEDLDKAYREDETRKKKYHIERKDRNPILTSCGVVELTRTYFRAKNDSSYVYLADKAMGIEPKIQ